MKSEACVVSVSVGLAVSFWPRENWGKRKCLKRERMAKPTETLATEASVAGLFKRFRHQAKVLSKSIAKNSTKTSLVKSISYGAN